MTLRLVRTSHNISIIAKSENVVFLNSPQHKKLRRGGKEAPRRALTQAPPDGATKHRVAPRSTGGAIYRWELRLFRNFWWTLLHAFFFKSNSHLNGYFPTIFPQLSPIYILWGRRVKIEVWINGRQIFNWSRNLMWKSGRFCAPWSD